MIEPEQLARKYQTEIHANEIVLLAYYIAAINIEATYHELAGGAYAPFPGICLTDTFQLYEGDDLISDIMADNASRRATQKKLPIKVIIGNPPYSVGARSANDNAANIEYAHLDERIRETYAVRSSASNKNALFDSYIRAIRWGSDRLQETGGVMAFVTNAGWLDSNSMNGLRLCLAEEFTSLHIFHLRGNQRTQGEQSRREGGKIFGSGSRQPVAISIMVRNPAARQTGVIRFHDIGDYLTREQKLATTARFGSIGGIDARHGWLDIEPDEHGDWLRQRDDRFNDFLPIGDSGSATTPAIFSNFSMGVQTNRDAWCVNSSKIEVAANVDRMLAVYDTELERFKLNSPNFENAKSRDKYVDEFVTQDATRISWTRSLKSALGKRQKIDVKKSGIRISIYRPFQKQFLHFDRKINEYIFLVEKLFPEYSTKNRIISVSGVGAQNFSALMLDAIPGQDTVAKGQHFPRYLYEPGFRAADGLFSPAGVRDETANQRDAVTDESLSFFQKAYSGETVSKDDLFHYVYGLLHSPDYRERYADNLTKQLPRIPLMKCAADFWAFVEAGRSLGDLHVGYESAEPYPVTIKEGDLRLANIADPVAYFRVDKMKFAGGRGATDKTAVVYNPRITITNIPLEAYDYVVNGRAALEWVIDRQCVKTEPASGIVNDANRYANETVGDPRYPFDLFCRMITVSLETIKIVRSLPALDILEPKA